MRRVTLQDKDSRETQMRNHVKTVAEAITDDLSGDALFEQYLKIRQHVHRYSIGNLMLMAWQAPDSRCVASRTAFSKIAEEQGHEGRTRTAKAKGKRPAKSWEEFVFVASGSRAVWIWGAPKPCTCTRKVTDPDTGEEIEQPHTFNRFFPVDVYQVEDLRYCDTGEPFEMPTLPTNAVHDEGLFDAILAFAASKGITVEQESLGGAAGVSKVGAIGLQKGDPFFLQVSPLVHELAHELLHDLQSRLDEGSRKLQEGEAEATAAVVLGFLGFDVSLSAAYLRNHRVKSEDVLSSMQRIADTAGEIVDFVEMWRERSSIAVPPPVGDAPPLVQGVA